MQVPDIYVASSWRNTERLDNVINALRGAGHAVYDFREGDTAFHWADVDPRIVPGVTEPDMNIDARQFRVILAHPLSQRGHERDMTNLEAAHTLVLVLPCGKSAHAEYGMAVAAGKRTIVYLTDVVQPELLYASADYIACDIPEVLAACQRY